ncbi:MAG TPA: AI-2E family transporter [Stellaceae bacterium]|nr:AI-2E family transporter [Stellaceae bacterium]
MAQDRRAPVNKWAVALAVAVALAFLYVVRLAVLPFLIAAAIAYVAEPPNVWLRRHLGLSREAAALVTYAIVMAFLGGLGYWVAVTLSADLGNAFHDAPRLLHKFFAELFGAEQVDLFGRRIDAGQLSQQILDALTADIGSPQQILTTAIYGFATITGAVLVIVLIFYFLHAGPQLAAGALWLVPPEYREEVAEIAREIDPLLRRYLVGLFVIFVFATIASWIAIRFALGLPFAVLLALLTGLLELIPVIGPMTSAALVGLLALERHGFWAVVAFAVYVTVFRLLIDRVVGPVVLGRAAQLHPTVVMFAFLAGGLFLGVAGVILAVPVAASVKVVLEHYYSQPTRRAP